MKKEESLKLANGHYAGENKSDEIKEAWANGFMLGFKHREQIKIILDTSEVDEAIKQTIINIDLLKEKIQTIKAKTDEQ